MRLEFHRVNGDTLEILFGPGRMRRVAAADVQALSSERPPQKPDEMVALGRRIFDFLNGPEGWLTEVPPNSAIEIDCSRVGRDASSIAWELLHDGTAFLVRRGIVPIRIVKGPPAEAAVPANRPLRLLFMACSPRNVEPVLDFELEEKIIHDATEKQPIHLIAEETGSVAELHDVIASYEPGFFDVFHLTGHADLFRDAVQRFIRAGDPLPAQGKPVFLTERDNGDCYLATVADLERAFAGRLPRAIFLSGCRTGELPEVSGAVSFAEELVRAGFPAVLGWALPVFDFSATLAGAVFYGGLAEGRPIEDALRATYREMTEPGANGGFQIPDWHLLRLFAPSRPDAGLVTAKNTPSRERIRRLDVESDFLDPLTQTEKVAGTKRFVGRRRVLQHCLPALDAESTQTGVVIWGMGGLGKSSVAARLCDRVQRERGVFRRVVLPGVLDWERLRAAIESRYPDHDAGLAALASDTLPLPGRIGRFLEAVDVGAPLLLVLDDFEQNATVDGNSAEGFRLDPAAFECLRALGAAIRLQDARSRLIVTSRYFHEDVFPRIHLLAEQLPQMDKTELRKKARRELAPDVDAKSLEQLLEDCLGNPRLFENLAERTSGQAVESVQEAMRETLKLREQFEVFSTLERRDLARLSVYDLPAPLPLVEAVAPGANFQRAVNLGVVELSDDSAGTAHRRVTAMFRPLVAGELTAEEECAVNSLAARAADKEWREPPDPSEEGRTLEVIRLARFGGEQEIACRLGSRVMNSLYKRSRYLEVLKLGSFIVESFEDQHILTLLAAAEQILGDTAHASEHLAQSIRLNSPENDGGKAFSLFHLASLRTQEGNMTEALRLYGQSLELNKRVGNLEGQAANLHQIAVLRAQQGDVAGAMDLYNVSRELYERIGHVHGQAANIHEMAGLRAQQGDVMDAMELYRQSMEMRERIDDVQGQSATLHEMAGLRAHLGDVMEAMELYRQSVEMSQRIGNVQGQAATLHDIAGLRANLGDVTGAMELYRQSMEMCERIGEVKGQAAGRRAMARLLAKKGDVSRAMEFYRQAMEMNERIGDVKSQAATLQEMGGLWAEQEGMTEAMDLFGRSMEITERIGDAKGQATTMHNMASLLARQDDLSGAMDLYRKSMEIQERIGNSQGQAAALHEMANVLTRQGDVNEAAKLYHRSIEMTKRTGDIQGLAAALGSLAGLAFQRGDLLEASDYSRKAVHLLGTSGGYFRAVTVLVVCVKQNAYYRAPCGRG